MGSREEIVLWANLFGYRGEKREDHLRQEFEGLAAREREFQREERKAERAERKREREFQLKNEEAVRAETDREREAEGRKEIELEKLRIQADGVKADPESNPADWADDRAKLSKLPNCVDRKDDLASWLTRFENPQR
ncbi:hypothetical protein PoB_006751900 [Plakobranchus ocellatus]|uniref:Uncharacterized protein n=1 Tax=Plakobranchus ocellatus TaxID=259542 RepID=A0AAV4DA20_9GAST|nr:hypothetical protein PoB_006751900 [Plakobranchus ocellatus]